MKLTIDNASSMAERGGRAEQETSAKKKSRERGMINSEETKSTHSCD